jgi:hypothetical protein
VDGRHSDSSPCGKLGRREGFARLQLCLGCPALFLGGARALAKQFDSRLRFRGHGSEKPADRPFSETGPMVLGGASESGEKTPLNPFTKETGTDTEEVSYGGKWPDASRFHAQSAFDPRAPLYHSQRSRRVPQKLENSKTPLVLPRPFHGALLTHRPNEAFFAHRWMQSSVVKALRSRSGSERPGGMIGSPAFSLATQGD